MDHVLNPVSTPTVVRAKPLPATIPLPVAVHVAPDPNTEPEPTTAGAVPLVPGAKVKLPKISLPCFNGDPINWIHFWDSYKSAIHSNADLSEVDKFNYMRPLLDRVAFDAVAGLTHSAVNYEQAIQILYKMFGNKQVIVSKHMDNLLNMTIIPSDRNLKELRQLYDHTEAHVRSLKSLEIDLKG